MTARLYADITKEVDDLAKRYSNEPALALYMIGRAAFLKMREYETAPECAMKVQRLADEIAEGLR